MRLSLADGLRRLRAQLHQRSGLEARLWRRLDGTRSLVLCYHRVIPAELARRDAVEEGLFVTPDEFRAQLDWLAAEFQVLPLHEIASALVDGRKVAPRACAITFDDGWRDNHDFALPELEKRGLPATVFVVSGRIGTEGAFWPDEVSRRLAAVERHQRAELVRSLGAAPGRDPVHGLIAWLKQLSEHAREEPLARLRAATPDPPSRDREILSWGELERMARAGVDIESHGASHVILTQVDAATRDRELTNARDALRERGHGRYDLFAYPSGAFDPAVCQAACDAGYRAGFTVDAGLASADQDRMAVPRFIVHHGISGSRAELFYRLTTLE